MKQLTIFLLTLFMILMSSVSCSTQPSKVTNPSPLPDWVKEEITLLKQSPSKSSRLMFSTYYNNQTVYFISPAVPDGFSQLFNAQHQLICSPTGGLTGYGDGQCKDFIKKTQKRKVLFKKTDYCSGPLISEDKCMKQRRHKPPFF